MRKSKHWARRVAIAATLALGSALALAGPAAAGWHWR
jgi:hypothetical protein